MMIVIPDLRHIHMVWFPGLEQWIWCTT